MKVVIVIAVCLLGAAIVQGRPAKLEDNTRGYEAPQNTPEESLKVSSELAEQASSDSSSVDVSVQSQTSLQQEDEEHMKDEELDSFESYRIPILVDLRERHDDGSYSFRIEQGDGIRRSEAGAPTGPDGGWQTVGEYSFTHPDGSHHELTYVADHNGFQPSSDMLPTPFPLEPWHLEQIAFAEAQKQQAAEEEEEEEEEGPSEQSYDNSADGVKSELVADAGAGDGGLGDASIADAAVEDASAGDVGAEIIGSSRLSLFVGDASTTDSGAQESASFGVISSARDAGVGDANVRGTGVESTGDNNGSEAVSSSTKAISAGDNDIRDTGLSGLAIFLANHGREYVEPSVSNDVFPAAVTASEQASEGSSSSASAVSTASASATGETSNNGETSINGNGGSESGQYE